MQSRQQGQDVQQEAPLVFSLESSPELYTQQVLRAMALQVCACPTQHATAGKYNPFQLILPDNMKIFKQ